MSVRTALELWKRFASLGKRPATQIYHAEIVKIFHENFPKLDTPPGEISELDAADFVEKISRYSPARFNSCLFTLRKVCPHLPKIKSRRVPPKIEALPAHDKFTLLLRYLDDAPQSHAGLVVRFLALTGLRIGEARKLKWTDMQPHCLIIPGELTKNGKPKAVPLMNGLGSVTEKLRAVGDRTRELILPQASVKRALNTACARAGIPRLTHHSMRRLFGTRCIESGVDVPTVSRWLGHSDGGALAARQYFHLLDPHSKAMAARVSIL